MKSKFDHLVIAAATLEEGVVYLEDVLGVTIPKGGHHPRMGTHNHLMKLSDTTFLEIIAINPQGEPPSRPRWFGLDDPYVRAQIAQEPQLLTWVVNTADLAAIHRQSQVPLGEIIPQIRGNLEWLITIPSDGHLPGSGLIPTVIQWQVQGHPARKMTDLGCSLEAIALYHPYPEWLQEALIAIGAEQLATVHGLAANQPPYMQATLHTPKGTVVLRSAPK